MTNTIKDKTQVKRSFSLCALFLLLAIIIMGVFYAVFIQRQLNTLHQMDESTITEIQHSQTQYTEQFNALEKKLETVHQERMTPSSDWTLLKTRYYLELAQINTHWGDKSQTTVALLQEADTLLATLHNPRLFKIRQTLAEEIVQRKAIPSTDILGLLNELEATQQLLEHFPIQHLHATKILPTTDTKPSTWRARIKENLHVLKQLVVINHDNESTSRLITPAYEPILREAIRLTLQETQWAVLQGDIGIYQLTLQQAINQVKRAFAMTRPETQALLKQLHMLEKIQLIHQQPIPTRTLEELNQFISGENKP